jgi:zinc transport system substrate-binding protein
VKENPLKFSEGIAGIIAVFSALACSVDDPVEETAGRTSSGTPLIYSVNYPLTYFAQRVGGEDVRVIFPAPPNTDPAEWAPAPDEIAAFQTADLILLNGTGHAGWVQRASLPRNKIVDTSASFRDRLIEIRGETKHTHGPAGAHVHAGTARTTWIDPLLAIEQARSIADALVEIRPEHAASFLERFADLETDLLQLDARFGEAAEALDEVPILFSHPVYQYFERRYRLNGESVHWEPDESPTPIMWQELNSILSNHPSQLMIWEATPEEETIRRLDSLGISSIVSSPCANIPEEGDWYSAMLASAAQMKKASSQRL